MTSLLIDPACDFTTLRERLDPLRWRLVSQGSQPILPGEPEHAVFERGTNERTHYTFNPVCRLRVLEFREAPDPATLAAIPAASGADVASWLASTDERTILRGLLAARLKPDSRFAARVAALADYPREAIALAAARASEAIHGTSEGMRDTTPASTTPAPPPPAAQAAAIDASQASRSAALAIIELIKAQVQPLLQALMNDPVGSVAASLRPRPGDYDLVFVPEVAVTARAAYEVLWAEAPRIERIAPGSRIECYVAPAGMLAYENELSRHFPGGYRRIAHLLNPQRTWVRWKYIRPGEMSGMSFEGLVWCDDHWAWFPKPYRCLQTLSGST